MPLLYFGLSDIGKARLNNQDSIGIFPAENLFIVADGMGGHKGGEIASGMAISAIKDFKKMENELSPKEFVSSSIHHANKIIFDYGIKNEELKGMGTTVVELFFKDSLLYIGNLGDSRAYLINQEHLYQLTKDHSLVQQKIDIGFYNREMAKKDPNKNILAKACGFKEKTEPDVLTYKVKRKDLFLLCSDGLHGLVADSVILNVCNEYLKNTSDSRQSDLEQMVKKLIELANQNGGTDNISAIAVLAT